MSVCDPVNNKPLKQFVEFHKTLQEISLVRLL